jgi:hypothetical protein
MNLCVGLRHPGSDVVFDDDLGRSVVTPLDPYATDIRVRVQAHRESAQDDSRQNAEETFYGSGYLVTMSLTAPLVEMAVGDLIDFPANCAEDHLTGRSVRIVEIVRSSIRFERDVFAVLDDTAEVVTPS